MRQRGFTQHHLRELNKLKKGICLLISGAGFTLIELLVAISISAILGVMGIAGYISYNENQVLQTSANEVVTMLNLAKSRAQSQIKPTSLCSDNDSLEGYTVAINAPANAHSSYKLNLNCSNGVDSLVGKEKFLPTGLNFDAGKTFFFPIQTGGVENSGYIRITSSAGEKTVMVNSLGGVSSQ